MLHALLHGKLAEDRPEPQRLEDVLTSSVSGMLRYVQAVDVLRAWLGEARDRAGRWRRGARSGKVEVWFGSRLALAEPDVILLLGQGAIVIEASMRDPGG